MSLGDRARIGNDGAFASVAAACQYAGRIYTSGEGQLWAVDLTSGDWERFHEADDWDTRFMLPYLGGVLVVESDHTPYNLDVSGNAEAGVEGTFEPISHAVAVGDKLFAMTGNMVAFRDELGEWQMTDGIDRGDVRALVEHDESGFWMLTSNGLAFFGADGETLDAGDAEAWGGTRAITLCEGKLYYVWEDGNIYGYDASIGEEFAVSDSGDWTARFLFGYDNALYVIDDAGTLHRVSLS